MADLKLTYNKVEDFYDISFDSSGDFTTTDGMDTSLLMSFFCQRRADETEISAPQLRSGWVGNLLKSDNFPDVGSKLWLVYSATNTQNTLNKAISYVRDSLSWLTELKYADSVNVTGSIENTSMILYVQIFKDANLINSVIYDLWANTLSGL